MTPRGTRSTGRSTTSCPRSTTTWPRRAAQTRELHHTLAALEPGRHEWRLLTGTVKTDAGAEMSLLRRAWDPDESMLLAREVNEAVLDMVAATPTTRQDICPRFNAAVQATAAGKSRRPVGISAQRRIPGTASPQEVMTAPLHVIVSEGEFLANLRFLQEYFTLSTRTLHRELSKPVSRAPGHTTLVGWLKGTELPRGRANRSRALWSRCSPTMSSGARRGRSGRRPMSTCAPTGCCWPGARATPAGRAGPARARCARRARERARGP